jgi:hypothetical protein
MQPALLRLGRRPLIAAFAASAGPNEKETSQMPDHKQFWPNDARLAVSLSLMFEGGQPISGAGGVIPDPIEKGVPDLPTNAFFAYGHYEGVPRVLDLLELCAGDTGQRHRTGRIGYLAI